MSLYAFVRAAASSMFALGTWLSSPITRASTYRAVIVQYIMAAGDQSFHDGNCGCAIEVNYCCVRIRCWALIMRWWATFTPLAVCLQIFPMPTVWFFIFSFQLKFEKLNTFLWILFVNSSFFRIRAWWRFESNCMIERDIMYKLTVVWYISSRAPWQGGYHPRWAVMMYPE